MDTITAGNLCAFTIEDDRLPKGFYRTLKDNGSTQDPEELEQMLQDYYRLKGWDEKGRLQAEQLLQD